MLMIFYEILKMVNMAKMHNKSEHIIVFLTAFCLKCNGIIKPDCYELCNMHKAALRAHCLFGEEESE